MRVIKVLLLAVGGPAQRIGCRAAYFNYLGELEFQDTRRMAWGYADGESRCEQNVWLQIFVDQTQLALVGIISER